MRSVAATPHLRGLAILALVGALAAGCGRCGSSAAKSGDGGADDAATVAATGTEAPDAELPAEPPEVKDTGSGRATAALRSVLKAYGIGYDDAALTRECNVDDDGASIDDLEDVAVKYGLEAGSVIVPAEHVLLPEAKMLPAIVIVDGDEDSQDFVVAWRLDGDRVLLMHPEDGVKWAPRADVAKSLHEHEMAMPLDEYREALAAPAYLDALVARAVALGVDAASARALVDRAAADPGWRGLGAVDATIRRLVERGGAVTKEAFEATYGCAFEKRCDGVEPIPLALWSAGPAPKSAQGEAQVRVRGAVLIAIAGRALRPDAGD
jgi:hypothetical protein